MFITVTCPKCGRGIKAKKKFVLSAGGIPCLKCKVRIPVSKEQVEAYSPAAPAAAEPQEEIPEAAPAPEDTLPSAAAEEKEGDVAELATPVEVEPDPIPEPDVVSEPLRESLPVLEPALGSEPEPDAEDPDTITPAIAPEPEAESPAAETSAQATGAQISFTCPHCQAAHPLRQSLAGKKIRCKSCSRIVKVAVDSPIIPGPEPTPSPASSPPDDDIPVLFSPPAVPVVELAPVPILTKTSSSIMLEPRSEARPNLATTGQFRAALTEAEERANSAEELLQKVTREKTTSEMAAFRKTRELEAQIRELTAQLKAKEEEIRTAGKGTMKRLEVETLLKTLGEALDANLEQEMSAHQNLVDDLKRQLTQALT